MPGTTILSFDDPGAYQRAVQRDGGFELLVTGRGVFSARLARTALPQACLIAGEENLARIAFVTVPSPWLRISLPVGRNAAMIRDGIESRTRELVTHGPGARFHERTAGAVRWRAILFPYKDLLERGRVTAGAAFYLPPGTCRWRPRLGALRQLSSLCDDALRAIEVRPELTARAGTARGLKRQLVEGVIECLAGQSIEEYGAVEQRHTRIIDTFEEVLRTGTNSPSSLADIIQSIGVADRTLRACCQAYWGMSPKRYVQMRLMQSVRHALLASDASAERLSEIARQHGFRTLGRFAAVYKAQFGELPSETLKRRSKVVEGLRAAHLSS